MSFLHVTLLAGAGLVAAPIILHMIMRQQPRRLEFPALRFIQARKDSNRRRLRFRQLLLLLLRCAAIAGLALALARPSIMASGMLGSREAPVAAAIVFDMSPRMNYRQHNETRLDAARATGQWLLEQLPGESDVAVMDTGAGASVFSINIGAARDRIKKLAIHADARPLGESLVEAARLVLSSDKTRKEVYLFTDATRASWTGAAMTEAARRMKEFQAVGFYVIDVGSEDPQDFSLGDLRINAQAISKNSPLRIETDFGCLGAGGERNIELLLGDGAKQTPRSRQTARLGPGESTRLEFRVAGLEPGVHQGVLQIAGEDGLAADNTRYFTVEVKPSWRVALAAPPQAADYTLFLSQALAPHRLRVQNEAAFDCETISLEALAGKPLDGYAAVCLLDPTPLAAAVWQKLTAYASGGGGVAIFLGRNAGSKAFNDPAALELLPGPLLRVWSAGDRDVYLSPESLDHPLLAKFRPLQTSVPWDGFPVFRHWQLGPLAADAAVIIPYSNTLPALVERPVGEGRVLMLTTPVSDAASQRDLWNTLPTGDEPWPFVMLANEMLYYLVGSNSTRLNYFIGETAVARLPRDAKFPMCLLTTPGGESIRQSIDERQHALVFTATDQPGSYRARAGGEKSGVDLGFSVNLSADGTSLVRASRADIQSVFGETPFRMARDRAEIDRNMNTARVGQELYPYVILLVALVLGGELALSNRFYRRDFRVDSASAPDKAVAAAVEATKRGGVEV